MKVVCFFNQRQLARLAVTGSLEFVLSAAEGDPLSKHVAHCADCRAAAESYTALADALPGALRQPAASGDFADAVWKRIQVAPAAQPRRIPWGVGAALAAACLAGAFLLIPRDQRTASSLQPSVVQPRQVAVNTAEPPEHAAQPPAVKKTSTKSASTHPVIKRKSPRRTTIEHRRPINRRSRQMMAQAPAVAQKTSVQTARASATPTWTQWGAYYETEGDYRSAEAAYSRAYQAKPDPSVAYSAGRAAECAGDVATAVDYYARILGASPQPKSEPSKGTMLWKRDIDTV